MAKYTVHTTGRESYFGESELIVSKTDPQGRITYANQVFVRVSQFSEQELLGAPHSIVRHPEMPRCVFRFLWDRITLGHEVFAYVLNMAKSGDHYWVFAHVTPTFDSQGRIVAYHSNRRKPDAEQVAKVQPVYAALLAEEQKHQDRKAGLEASYKMLGEFVTGTGMSYDEFVFSL